MPQDNKIKELIINQLTKAQYKELVETDTLSKTELYIITDNANYTEEEILTLLEAKQNKLTAGDGVTIENDIITINLDDFYTSNAIDELLSQKANISEAGYNLDYTDNILTIQNMNGDELSSVKIVSAPEVDNVTINLSSSNQLQAIGEITRNGIPKYTWIGTQEEYNQAKLNGAITELTEVLILDSEAETITPIAQYDAPTKLSELANDMNFVTQSDLENTKEDLQNQIDAGIDDVNLVHKTGTETIDGFKQFKQKIVIENTLGKGRIAHKPVDTSLEDGYIEFGDNTLLYGKQNIQGELYDEKHDIFHAGNLVAGNNITITENNGVYSINGKAGGGTGGGSIDNVDNETIIIQDDGSISAQGVLDQNTEDLTAIKFWSGTLEEYEALGEWDDDTIYNVTDDVVETGGLTELPIASTDILGGVKVDGKTIKVTEEGVISSNGGGLEIGDIGIAPLGIDETRGKRRYLNGQLIIQDQYVQFTNKVKSAVALYPSLACTESEWQTTVIMTVGGQVGKFVIDDEAGTIRLPKIIMPIQGLTDLSKLGQIVEAGLPNITGSVIIGEGAYFANSPNGCFASFSGSSLEDPGTGGSGTSTANFDASASNLIYGNSTTVQQEQIQYPYFIQVATGAETEDNIINEIELNNPFSLLDYKYSEYELNNLSWLRSNGQYNSKSIYPAVYDLLLKEYNNPNRLATFNKDVFTVVGSPTITEDGVASGFTASNYLDTKFLINTDVVIKGSFTVSSKTSSTVGQLFSIGNASDNNGLRFVISTSGFLQMAQLQTWINYVWEAKYVINIPIFYEVIISETSVNLKLTQNNTEIANVSATVPNNISGTISLGREFMNGSIDLKQFSITVDGNKVFSGANSKVKLDTETFTDYDFVLNTADETFMLPTKVKLASGKAVVGNGMTLGLTDGTNNAGARNFSLSNNEYIGTSIESYGTSVGTTATSINGLINEKTAGVTTDPTKSGIETSDSDLYLYFYVGETVQNANLINAGRIEEKLSDCITRNDCKAYIIETYQNGTSWYRIYSDGWCEQGGTGIVNKTATEITLLKPYKDVNYSVITNTRDNNATAYQVCILSRTTTAFSWYYYNSGGAFPADWRACGYIR